MFYTGTVTNCQNGAPLRNIPVSDGRNVTYTDADGRYALPGWERSRMLHVGLLTQKRDDWFVCTGNTPGVYDFSVSPVEQAEDFCFLHISDSEVNGRKQLDWVDFLAKQAFAHKPAFLLNTGDLFAVEGTRRHAEECTNEQVGCPIRYCIGNHDFTEGDYGEQLFESLYGPTWCSFDLGQLHFVCLSIGKGDKPSGYEPQDQFLWLENDLKAMTPGKKLVVLDHDHCTDPRTLLHNVQGAQFDFSPYPLAAWVFGHLHTNFDIVKNGVHFICSCPPGEGGIDSSAAGVRKIRVSGHGISSEYICNRNPVAKAGAALWRTQLPGHCEHSQPVLWAGDLFICTADYGTTQTMGIYRICGQTGQILWFYNTENSIQGDIDIQEGKVYLQDCGGTVYCLNAEDGTLIWKTPLPLGASGHTRMNVLVRRGVVLAGKHRQLFGCDAQTGQVLWSQDPLPGGDTPAKALWDEARQQVIFFVLWRMTGALDIETGAVRWQNTDRTNTYRNNTPLILGDTLYGSGQDWIYCNDLATGAVLKKLQRGVFMDSPGSPVAEGDVLYWSTSDKGVVAVDRNTFEILRFYPAGPTALMTAPYIYGDAQTVEGSPVIVGDRLIFAASDGMLRVYDKNTAVLQKQICIGAPCITTPLPWENGVYVVDFDGQVAKFLL